MRQAYELEAAIALYEAATTQAGDRQVRRYRRAISRSVRGTVGRHRPCVCNVAGCGECAGCSKAYPCLDLIDAQLLIGA